MSAKKLQDKIAIITGASKGLGKAMALALAEAGAKLALVSRNLEQLKETAAAVGKFGTYAEVLTVMVPPEAAVFLIPACAKSGSAFSGFDSRLESTTMRDTKPGMIRREHRAGTNDENTDRENPRMDCQFTI